MNYVSCSNRISPGARPETVGRSNFSNRAPGNWAASRTTATLWVARASAIPGGARCRSALEGWAFLCKAPLAATRWSFRVSSGGGGWPARFSIAVCCGSKVFRPTPAETQSRRVERRIAAFRRGWRRPPASSMRLCAEKGVRVAVFQASVSTGPSWGDPGRVLGGEVWLSRSRCFVSPASAPRRGAPRGDGRRAELSREGFVAVRQVE